MVDNYKKLIQGNQKFIDQCYMSYWNYMYKSKKLSFRLEDDSHPIAMGMGMGMGYEMGMGQGVYFQDSNQYMQDD